jgi:hypothetical protein
MDETATRRKKINPKLYEVGWEQVPESEILEEQRAYITPDRWALSATGLKGLKKKSLQGSVPTAIALKGLAISLQALSLNV